MAEQEEYGLSSEARARRRRSVITLLVVLLSVFFAAWYALSYIRADDQRRAEGSATSTEPSGCEVAPEQVDVNVYNATNREGLAAKVARDLKSRGFTVKTVANDPKQAEIEGRGELRFGEQGRKGADLLSEHVGEFAERTDERARVTVDVVLGPRYRHLVSEERTPAC